MRALAGLARRRGLMHLGFDELATILRFPSEAAPRCYFGFGEADRANRANDALARALKNPMMDKGACSTAHRTSSSTSRVDRA